MKIKALVLASMILVCGSAFAQETNKDANGNRQFGPYETNKFWDNWFISVGAGANVGLDNVFSTVFQGKNDFTWGGGLAVDFEVGKWFTPCWGARLGWNGLKVGSVDYVYQSKLGNLPGALNYNYIHVDGLMNFSHLVAGYKEKRLVNVVPYITAGCVITNAAVGFDRLFGMGGKTHAGLGLGAGIMVPFRLGGVVSLVPELRFVGMKQEMLEGEALVGDLTALLSLQFNLGKNNWTRVSTTMAATTAALAAAEASRNALQASNDKLAADCANAADKANRLQAENDDLKNQLVAAVNTMRCTGVDLAENPVCAYFDMGKTKLSAKEEAHFEYNVKTAIAANKGVKLTVMGSADKFGGSNARNQKLAKMRADYIYDLLTNKFGLDANAFTLDSQVVEGNKALARAVIISK